MHQVQRRHTIRKSQIFVQKSNFDKTPTFSRVFHPKFFLTIFLVKSNLSTAKKSKTKTFSRVFHPPKKRQFSREIKVEFLDKKWRFRTVWYSNGTSLISVDLSRLPSSTLASTMVVNFKRWPKVADNSGEVGRRGILSAMPPVKSLRPSRLVPYFKAS